jgi:hypothetical protein
MVMVGHQAIGRHPEIPNIRRFLEDFYEYLIFMPGQENVLSPPATVHDMIPGSRIFYAQRSRHNKLVTNCSLKVNNRPDPISHFTISLSIGGTATHKEDGLKRRVLSVFGCSCL